MANDALLSNISKTGHDLRNALAVIYSYAQLLELSLEASGTEEDKSAASALASAVRDMETLLKERFDSLKQDAGQS